MDLDDIKRGLRAEIKKRENEQYSTFQCNVRQMCKDVLDKLEEQETEIEELKAENLNLKAKNIELQSFYNLHGNVDNYIDKLKAENEQLKARLETVNDLVNGARDMMDGAVAANNLVSAMCERRLRRALWLARAEMAKHIATFCYYALHYGRVPVREIYQCQDKWDEVERMCLKKAEEY